MEGCRKMTAIGLLIIKLVLGLTYAAHGTQKLFGWFGGYGIKGTAGWLESIGIKPGVPMVILAGLAELVGGLLFVFASGWLLWLAVVLIVVTMLVAIFKVHNKSYWATNGGFEYNLLIIVVAIGLALLS
jgi:putative oxidoreductase